VGVPKTGTTYLQDVLWDSAGELRRQGFRLPLRDVEDHFFLTLALRDRLDPSVDPRRAITVLDRLRRDLRQGREDVIISHELLAAVDQSRTDELTSLLDDLEVHVVVTARDLARQVPAEWQQQVKTRAQVPYARFVQQVVSGEARHFWSVQDVPGVATRWGRRLPPERIHVVTVPPRGAPKDVLLARFCAATGLRPEGLRADRARMNESIGFEQAELLRRVNVALGTRLPRPRQGYGAVAKTWFAEGMLATQQTRQPLVLPAESWDWCVARAKESVVAIEQAGYVVHGSLDDLIPAERPDEPLRRPTEAEVAASGVEAIAAMLDDRHRGSRPSARRRVSHAARGLVARARG
jgi:hypothetical protein